MIALQVRRIESGLVISKHVVMVSEAAPPSTKKIGGHAQVCSALILHIKIESAP
jgi:hypothetical protein